MASSSNPGPFRPTAARLALAAAVMTALAGVTRAQQELNVQPQAGGVDLPADAKESTANVTVNDSPEARKDIETARQMERQKEWLKAAGWYQQVLEKYRTRVVAWKANDHNVIERYRGIVYEVQQSLAKWPPEGVNAYRSRYEATAQQQLDAAAPDDLNALNGVLENYFITESGKAAGLRLIDLHMEAGEFDAAARIGDLLLDYYPGDHLLVERPRVLFRTAVAHHFCGDDKAAQARADELKQKFPDATGTVFGKDVALVQSLDGLMKAAPVASNVTTSDAWPMFGGSPDRAHVSPAPGHTGARIASIDLPRPAARQQQQQMMVRNRFGGMQVIEQPSQPLADEDRGLYLGIMPVVDGGELFFQDGTHLWARSLDSGFPLVGWTQSYTGTDEFTRGVYQLRNSGGVPSSNNAGTGPRPGYQYTLTLTDNGVLAVMGHPSRIAAGYDQFGMPVQGAGNPDSGTRLVCLDRKTGKERWKVSPAALEGQNLKDEERERLRALDFSGSPLVVGDNVYVIGRGGKDAQFENCYVLCFDVASGAYRWSCLVASSNIANNAMMMNGDGSGSPPNATASHLAYAGGRLYVNTNLGALAAIDAYNGSVVWLSLYRRENGAMADMPQAWVRRPFMANLQPPPRPWEINPVIAQDGKLFVLPADSRFLLVYDQASGKELKAINLSEFQPEAAANVPNSDQPRALIGVIDGAVVLTAADHVYTVRWADYDANKSFADNVPQAVVFSTLLPSDRANDSMRGRAFVTSGAVMVTTDKALWKLDVKKGLKAENDSYPAGRQGWDEAKEGPGNVIATGEYVVIAGSAHLNVYTDMALARAKRDAEVAAHPTDVGPRLDYSQVMFAAGQTTVALEKLKEATDLLGGLEHLRPGPDRQRVFNDAISFSRKLASDKRGESNEAAVKFYDVAAAAADTPGEQVNYRIERARFSKVNRDAHSLETAVRLYQEILADADWRAWSVANDDESAANSGTPNAGGGAIQAGRLAIREIADIKSKHADAYAATEKKAEEAMRQAQDAKDAGKLMAVAVDYPNADVAPKAMLAAAAMYEQAGNPAEATHVLRGIYRDYADAADKAQLLEAMVRNYAAIPGGLDIAIGRLRQAKNFADRRLTQPLKLPDGKTIENVTFKEALAALVKARPAEANPLAAALPDLHVPDARDPAGAASARHAFLPANDPKCVSVQGVLALLATDADPQQPAGRTDRLVAGLRDNKLAIFAPGQSEPLGTSDAFTDAPTRAAWLEDGSKVVAWSHNELVALDGDSAKVAWTFALKQLSPSPADGGTALDGVEVVNDTPPGNTRPAGDDVVIINGQNVRMFQQRRFRGANIGRPQVNGLAPADEQPAAPGTPEQIRHVVRAGSNRVVVGTSAGRLVCLDAATGKVQWDARLGTRAIEKVVANADFTVARVPDEGAVRLVVLDNFDGRVQGPVRSFPTAQGMVPQNMALSPDGMLVWTTPDRLCGQDLYESSRNPTFEFRGGQMPPPDINANGVRRFNGGNNGGNPALLFAGCTRDGQLLIRGDRILAIENGGLYVTAHSLETGLPLQHEDLNGHQTITRLSIVGATGPSAQAANGADVNVTLATAGPYVYAVGPRSLISYNLDRPAHDHWYQEPLLNVNPNFQSAVPTKTELLVVGEPAARRPTDVNLGAPVKQVRLYNRKQVPDESGHGPTVECGLSDYIVDLSDPSGIKACQAVEGGFYYLAGDQTLHYLAGSKS